MRQRGRRRLGVALRPRRVRGGGWRRLRREGVWHRGQRQALRAQAGCAHACLYARRLPPWFRLHRRLHPGVGCSAVVRGGPRSRAAVYHSGARLLGHPAEVRGRQRRHRELFGRRARQALGRPAQNQEDLQEPAGQEAPRAARTCRAQPGARAARFDEGRPAELEQGRPRGARRFHEGASQGHWQVVGQARHGRQRLRGLRGRERARRRWAPGRLGGRVEAKHRRQRRGDAGAEEARLPRWRR
mmetsp:Transcript_46507/g.133940  ORF Transcript_46507/g.133940 Transcript_46507/m.133940 type:complete len:243 (+) Transcript_46507:856-1584(+)